MLNTQMIKTADVVDIDRDANNNRIDSIELNGLIPQVGWVLTLELEGIGSIDYKITSINLNLRPMPKGQTLTLFVEEV